MITPPAAGSITSCRDVSNQAVFVLKGKPLNVWDLKRDVTYNLMQSLNVEDYTEGLRYDKVMGKNTPERKDYIMDKLVVPVEE